jgi:two-component system nitrogen regulation response regulator GlnG/two-component system response regulator HydG
VNGRVLKKARLELGDRIALGDDLLLILVKRPSEMPAPTFPEFPFGEPDAFGWVGESLAAWELRRELMFLGARDEHALVHGPTGAGKALVVNALHGLSRRSRHPLVVRSSATVRRYGIRPSRSVDAE